jgi:PKD repeat protein
VVLTSTGALSGAPLSSGGFTAGVLASQPVTMTAVETGVSITATDGAVSGTSNAFDVAPGPLDHFVVEAAGGGAIPTQTAGAVFNVRITAQDALNHTAAFNGTVAISSNGTLAGAPVTSGTLSNGVLAIQALTITSAQSNTTLTATDAGGSGKTGISNPFTVAPGAAAMLAVGTQPSATEAASVIAPAVQIIIKDAHGNNIPDATNVVSLAMGNNPAGGVLSGTTTVAAANGVATFDTLAINKPGAGYTLAASAAGLSGATTAPFDIVDTTPPGIVSNTSATATSTTPGQVVQFSFVVSDASPVTYQWDFGDGVILTTTETTVAHAYNAPGAYQVTVIATDAGGLSTAGSPVLVTVSSPASAPPADLLVQSVMARLRFPSSLSRDTLALKGIIQLSDGFNPAGQVVAYNLLGIQGQVVLDGKGRSMPRSSTEKVMLRYKKLKKGQAFTARPAKLYITLRNRNLSTLVLSGVSTLNTTTTNRKGDAAMADAFVLLQGHQAYERDGIQGLYKAKQDMGGAFKARFRVR